MGAASSVPGQPVLGPELRGEGRGCLHVSTGQTGQETAGPAWDALRKEAEAAVGGGVLPGRWGCTGRGSLPASVSALGLEKVRTEGRPRQRTRPSFLVSGRPGWDGIITAA